MALPPLSRNGAAAVSDQPMHANPSDTDADAARPAGAAADLHVLTARARRQAAALLEGLDRAYQQAGRAEAEAHAADDAGGRDTAARRVDVGRQKLLDSMAATRRMLTELDGLLTDTSDA